MSYYLLPPYDTQPLRCVEHHRCLRLVGYCPSCLLRRIDDIIQHPPGYGISPGWQDAALAQIREITDGLRVTQLRRRFAPLPEVIQGQDERIQEAP